MSMALFGVVVIVVVVAMPAERSGAIFAEVKKNEVGKVVGNSAGVSRDTSP